MGTDHRADAVFQGSDDPAAVRIVLGVGAEYHRQIEIQPHGKSADLHVALLQHVEQPHLDLGAQIGQFVHAEDPAVAPRNQPEVQHVFAGQVSSLGVLDEVNFADQVGDGDVGRGQLL